MIVRELLLDALTRTNIARAGSVQADQLEKAFVYFKSALREYSDQSLITAYQNAIETEISPGKTIIGKYNLKRGVVMHCLDELPSVDGYYPERDVIEVDGGYWGLELVGDSYVWTLVDLAEYADFVPDVECDDIERIVAVYARGGAYEGKPDIVSLANFYGMGDDVCVAVPAGEGKVALYTKVGGTFNIVYNTRMKVDRDDSIELPAIHYELLVNRIAEGVARTAEQKSYFGGIVNDLENQIIGSNSVRVPTRELY